MSRVLVTGGSGFIGRTLVPGLEVLGHEVLAPSHADLDLTDAEDVRDYLRGHQPDVIVHGATRPGHRNAADPAGLVEANERMFFNLVHDRGLCPHMVFLSSGAVYDAEHYTDRMAETYFDAHVPADEHGFSKYVIAKYIEGTEHITELRVFGIFGPHEDYSIRFISNAICKTLFDVPVTLRQDRRFDYLWVEDLVPIVAAFIGRDGAYRAYNVTPDKTSSLRTLGEMVIETAGGGLQLQITVGGLGLPYSGDNARLHAELPDLRFTSDRDAVERLYGWYAQHRNEIDPSLLLVDR